MKLKNCKDIFHVECFVNYADSNLKQSKFPVLHPCTNDCKRFEIFEYEMRKFLPDDKFSKLSELSLKNAIDSSKNMDFCTNIFSKSLIFQEQIKKKQVLFLLFYFKNLF